MASKYVICGEIEFPGAPECTMTIRADNDEELLEMAVRHGMNIHGRANTEAYRDKVRSQFQTGNPPR